MDGQEYLNQISASSRPTQKSANGIFSSKIFIVSAIGVAALIVIIIIGAILGGGNKGGEKNLSFALLLHLDNTVAEIDEYQPSLKSSDLRSSSSSLSGVLKQTSSDLTEYLTNKYGGVKEKDMGKDLVEEATAAKDELENELFEAKINGVLDRTFAHKMTYEITLFMAEENKLMNTAKNETLKDLLLTSYKGLDNLYSKFNDFSEVKN